MPKNLHKSQIISNFAPKISVMSTFRTHLLLCCLLLVLPLSAEEAGVSWKLAHRRAQLLDSLSYTLTFNIPDDRRQPVTGTAKIGFALKERADVVLDFQGELGEADTA